jgi:hypothetical protein
MDTNRHEFFAPKAFGALECGGLTPLTEAKLVIAYLADNLCGELRGRPWAACCRRNLGEVFDQYKAKSCAIKYSG